MRTPRIYIEQKLCLNQTIEIPRDKADHLLKVLKRKQGNQLVLFNGLLDDNNNHGEYLAEITNIHRNKLLVVTKEYIIKNTQPNLKLELAQCISKSSHFDLTLQKSVELGVTTITPIISQRSEQTLKQDNTDKKLARWQKIIIHACEQSGRTDIPVLNPPIDITYWLSKLKNEKLLDNPQHLFITLCTKTNSSLDKLPLKKDDLESITIIIGSEGGFSEQEIDLLVKNNFNTIKLGPRILRTETAGIASIAIIQFLTGNL